MTKEMRVEFVRDRVRYGCEEQWFQDELKRKRSERSIYVTTLIAACLKRNNGFEGLRTIGLTGTRAK